MPTRHLAEAGDREQTDLLVQGTRLALRRARVGKRAGRARPLRLRDLRLPPRRAAGADRGPGYLIRRAPTKRAAQYGSPRLARRTPVRSVPASTNWPSPT